MAYVVKMYKMPFVCLLVCFGVLMQVFVVWAVFFVVVLDLYIVWCLL